MSKTDQKSQSEFIKFFKKNKSKNKDNRKTEPGKYQPDTSLLELQIEINYVTL